MPCTSFGDDKRPDGVNLKSVMNFIEWMSEKSLIKSSATRSEMRLAPSRHFAVKNSLVNLGNWFVSMTFDAF